MRNCAHITILGPVAPTGRKIYVGRKRVVNGKCWKTPVAPTGRKSYVVLILVVHLRQLRSRRRVVRLVVFLISALISGSALLLEGPLIGRSVHQKISFILNIATKTTLTTLTDIYNHLYNTYNDI